MGNAEPKTETIATEMSRRCARVRDEIARVIVGQDLIVEQCLIAMLAGGHMLLEGVPGLGKTELVKSLAQSMDLSFSRIQFTPDMMPMDITGTDILVEQDDGARAFTFRRGPVFANVVLADEINRSTPKTQAALLEAMQESSVTISGTSHELTQPFFVLATQNPIEMEGTYPLPEAQLDRFLFKGLVQFPTPDELAVILDRTTGQSSSEIRTVIDRAEILEIREAGRKIELMTPIRDLVVALVMSTHPERSESPELVKKYVRYGVSPRGGQAILLGARYLALLSGRLHVAEEDIRALIHPALRHRLLLNFEAESEGVSTDEILDEVAKAVSLNQFLK